MAQSVLGFALPTLVLAWGLASLSLWPWLLAPAIQVPRLLAEKWFFLAQAKHPQNLHCQVMS
jgi:hypothetical protein